MGSSTQSWDEFVLAAAIKNGSLRWWGSDCTECGNATPGSMRCDSCGSAIHTVHLFAVTKAGSETKGAGSND